MATPISLTTTVHSDDSSEDELGSITWNGISGKKVFFSHHFKMFYTLLTACRALKKHFLLINTFFQRVELCKGWSDIERVKEKSIRLKCQSNFELV